MIIQPVARLDARFRAFARGASVAVVLFGCLVLLGWLFDITELQSVFLGQLAIKTNSAVGFVLAGVSMWLALSGLTDRRIRGLKQVCAVVVALIGLLTLSQYLSGWNFGIDQLLFKEPAGAFDTTSPNRMAPSTALVFLLIGLSLLLLDRETRHGLRPAEFVIIPAGVIALLGLLGYLYDVAVLYRFLDYTPMAGPTAMTFLVLCLGMLAVAT